MFLYEVDNAIPFTLSRRCNAVSSPELVVAVEVAYQYNVCPGPCSILEPPNQSVELPYCSLQRFITATLDIY